MRQVREIRAGWVGLANNCHRRVLDHGVNWLMVAATAYSGFGPTALRDVLHLGLKAVEAAPDVAAVVKDVIRWLQTNSQYLVQHPE